MSDFQQLTDLASERVGGAVLYANDEFFAPKENLLKPSAPVWKEGVYTDRGKWMDGWESRRRREPGHDHAILRLGLPGIVRGVVVDTSYFRGNYPEQCSIEACNLEGNPSLKQLQGEGIEWFEILGKSDLEGHSQNEFEISNPRRCTHLRFHIYPDGGVARLRVHGDVLPDLQLWRQFGMVDLAGIENGSRVVAASDMFFGHAENLTMPGRGKDMGDGWETKRRRGPGHDWVVLELAASGRLKRVEVDTNHFKGNYPDRFSLEGCHATREGFDPDAVEWKTLIEQTKLQAHARHPITLDDKTDVTHVRFNIYPDGGVSRLRLWGEVSRHGWVERSMERLNELSEGAARREFLACCGSTAWAAQMVEERPFLSEDELYETADEIWEKLGDDDWLEAFSAHPKIGEKKAEKETGETSEEWSKDEQSGTAEASRETLQELHDLNHEYYEKFGYIYIVCATGKSADEMLQILKERIKNDPANELELAAEEQRKITQLRLEKLLTP